MAMQSFTFGTRAAQAAVVAAVESSGEPFMAEFNDGDRRAILAAVEYSPSPFNAPIAAEMNRELPPGGKRSVYWTAEQVRAVLAALVTYWDTNPADERCERAGEIASDIATVYGVEWI